MSAYLATIVKKVFVPRPLGRTPEDAARMAEPALIQSAINEISMLFPDLRWRATHFKPEVNCEYSAYLVILKTDVYQRRGRV